MSTHALPVRQAKSIPWRTGIAQGAWARGRKRRPKVGLVSAPPTPDMGTAIYRLAPRV
jgi:hypothetical protein